MINIIIKLPNASKTLSRQINQIARITVKKVRGIIKFDDIKIVIKKSKNSKTLQDIDGVGGYCPSADFVELSIDLNHPQFLKSPKKVIEKSLIHELHHVARNQAGIKLSKETFLENMFSEGLADQFVFEMTGSLPRWIIDISKNNKTKLFKKAKKYFNKKITKQNYNKWFTKGSSESDIPKYAGYALGLDLVRRYLKNNSWESAASLVALPVKNIFITNLL